jgi:hypothetical protein
MRVITVSVDERQNKATSVAAVALPIGQTELHESGEQINSRQSLRGGNAVAGRNRPLTISLICSRNRESSETALQTKLMQTWVPVSKIAANGFLASERQPARDHAALR